MERRSLVCVAKLSKQTGRFDEMHRYMKTLALLPQKLILEETELMSFAFTNVIGSRLKSLKAISTILQNEGVEQLHLVQSYKESIEVELKVICSDMLEIIDSALLPNSTSGEISVLFSKIKGDCHRYLVEFQNGDVRKESAAKALGAYSSASSIATSDLPPTHPIRLGLALNFSVFYYEVLNSPDRACHLKPFDEMISEVNAAFDDWLDMLVETRNQQAQADQELKEYNERTIYDVGDMVMIFVNEKVSDGSFTAVNNISGSANSETNELSLRLIVHPDIDYTAEYSEVKQYLNSIYCDADNVKLLVEVEWGEEVEAIELHSQRRYNCCIS